MFTYQSVSSLVASIGLCAFASILTNANAQTIDQQQPIIDTSRGFLGVGGDSQQKLAQTFEVGVSGRLMALDLPLGCNGDLRIEVRQQNGSLPNGRFVRRLDVNNADFFYDGFRRFSFLVPIDVSRGDKLAFTVEMTDGGNCNYGTSPAGDTYAGGQGFFDSRPNPPGWLAFKAVPDPYKDLPFKTIMEDITLSGRGRCIATGQTDPDTGEWLELPIDQNAPICRCFEDQDARELRCALLHPDFQVLRRTPWPLTIGKPFVETFEFTPLADLDGPVRVTREGAGRSKSITHKFGYKAQIGKTEIYHVKSFTPYGFKERQGIATFNYDMKDAAEQSQKTFGIDLSIGEGDLK